MSEQIISAELHRDDDDQIVGITFNGVRYDPVAEPPVRSDDTQPVQDWQPVATVHAPAQLGAVIQPSPAAVSPGRGLFGFRQHS